MKLSPASSSLLLLLLSQRSNINNQANAFSISSNTNTRICLFGINTPSSTQLHVTNTCRDKSNSPIVSSLNSAYIADLPSIATTTTTEIIKEQEESKSFLDDGFVFGLEGSGLSRPKGKVAQVVVEGDNLTNSPFQITGVSTTFLSHALFGAHAIAQLNTNLHGDITITSLTAIATIVSSWVFADLGSGVLHWSVDNYGNGRTPVMGGIIAAFQGHHSAPWTITQRGFFNNVSKLCIPFGIPTVAAISFLAGADHPMVCLFFSVFCSLEILSQEFHKWSHMTPKELNPVVLKLQKLGLTVGRIPHAMHHNAPYEGKYCIVSGFCNDVLDESGFFRRLERVVYEINGIEANSWKLDPKLKAKTLRGEYRL